MCLADLMTGVHSNQRDDDRKVLDCRYPTDCPFKNLYVKKRILKLTLASRVCQCRFLSMGVTWSELRVPATTDLSWNILDSLYLIPLTYIRLAGYIIFVFLCVCSGNL